MRKAFPGRTVIGIALGVVALGALWFTSGTARANPGTSVSVSLDSNSVNAGDNFDVNVVVDTDVPIRGVQFALDFDASLIQVVSVDEGSFLKDWANGSGNQTLKFPEPQIDNNAGHVTDIGIAVVGTGQGGASGHGVLATYHMTAKAGAKGVSPLKLSDLVVSDAAAATIPGATSTNGQVGIGGAQVTPMETTAPSNGTTPSSTAATTTTAGKTAGTTGTSVSSVKGASTSKSSGSSNGLNVPWEAVGGVMGAVVVAGGVTVAMRRRRA